MKVEIFLTLILVLGFGASNAWTQTPTPFPVKTISGGVLNGKATSLVKPPYPPAAKAVGASGAVNVQVTIDENGDVVSAKAVSGHPLLKQACEQAALASKFAPTLLQGQPVKITGVIVYNFVMPMTFAQIGYELSLAENSQSIKNFQINSISGTFPSTWAEEKELLKNLDARLAAKNAKTESPQKTQPPSGVTNKTDPPEGIYTGNTVRIGTRIGNDAVALDYSLDDDSIEIIRELQSKLENRLSVNEKILWSFKLGKTLGKLKAEINSEEKTRSNIYEINQLGENAPSETSKSVSAKIKELVEFSRQTTADVERNEKLTTLIESLRNLKSY